MNQNSACSEISNHRHPAIVFTKYAIARDHSRTCAVLEGLQLSLTEDSVDASEISQIITIDNTHFFNTEEFPTPERDRAALQEGFYMASSVLIQPVTVKL